MCVCQQFEKSLHYISPSHGGWGVIRVAALLPESYMLFVAPFACGRHGALGGIINKVKNRISYLYIDESDIVSGDYEHLVPEAVSELFSVLEKKPKVLCIFVSCLDDLLGTDHEALNAALHQKFPETNFLSCHMNPLQGDTNTPPQVGLQNALYSLLELREKNKKQINIIGNNAYLRSECEIFSLLKEHGIFSKHIGLCKTYDEFLSMSESSVNLVLSPIATQAAKNLERDLQMPFLLSYVSYDLDEIENDYKKVEQFFNVKFKKLPEYKMRAEQKIIATQKIIGKTPIALDYQATKKACTLANTLLHFGFNVVLIAAQNEIPEFEKTAYEHLKLNFPDVKIVDILSHSSARFPSGFENCLCIGFDVAYMTGSTHVVSILDDEGLYGFYAIEFLMDEIVRAFETESNLEKIVKEAGLVV